MQNLQSVDNVRYSSASSTVQVDNCHLGAKSPHDPESKTMFARRPKPNPIQSPGPGLRSGLMVGAVCLGQFERGPKPHLIRNPGPNAEFVYRKHLGLQKLLFVACIFVCVCVFVCIYVFAERGQLAPI